MQLWVIVVVISLVFSVPVLMLSYYWLFLFASSLRYPKNLAREDMRPSRFPLVSVLIASFNEKFVIERTLNAVKDLDYPRSQLQVVIADDSTDETRRVIDDKVEELKQAGIRAVVSRRATRENFKQGALNKSMDLVEGEYVLLLDADSTVTPKVLTKGLAALETHRDAAFVSYRVGHYNRNQNLITRIYALTLDMGDLVSKMGSYIVNTPFSFQGGFALVSAGDLRRVGLWANERMADDADISIKLYLTGKRGIYLSNVRVMSEDPPTLEAWKKQAARTSQGWTRCVSKYWNYILRCPNISLPKRLALILMLIAPFSSLSWIIVNFVSALSIVFGLIPPGNSIFNNPAYVVVMSLPVVLLFVSAAYSLKIQNLMTAKNLALIPILSYTSGCTMILGSIAFIYGIFGRTGFFHYRTPKTGQEAEITRTEYFGSIFRDRTVFAEAILAVVGIVFAVLVAEKQVWLLSLSLAGFGALTLKSMNLTQFIRTKRPKAFASIRGPLVAPSVRAADQPETPISTLS